jgi:hypothetical protein
MRLLIVIIALLAFYNGSVFGESPKPEPLQKEPLTWGEFDPGKGFVVGQSELGSMSLSFYALGRYINQQPVNQSYTDHLGRKLEVNTRNDIELHRMMVWLKGYAYDPKFRYNVNFWTVNATKNFYLIGQLAYAFDPKFELSVGIDGLPGVRSLNGQHPYFLGTDRHLGDEFFKPGFTMGVSARGQLSKSVFYRLMVGNNISEIGVTTPEMTGDLAYGGSIWVLPTGEFGPRGGYGDYEMHSELASRFGLSVTQMRQNGYAQQYSGMTPKTTTIRSSDGVNVFDPGALAPGVTVKNLNYTIVSPDIAFKHQGFFIDFNYYFRWLDGFSTYGGKVPQDEIFDHGGMIQIAKQIKPQKLEIYSAYTYIWGEFNNPWEIAVGSNYYPTKTRNWRVNMMVNHVEQTPMQSGFGYYSGGLTGETIVLATDVLF